MRSSLRARAPLESARTSLLKWARATLAPLSTVKAGPPWDDLASLGRMVGNASVVALSEGVHCAAEPLEFRNRVLQYLVQEKGFTAIAIESGLVESRIVYEYVRGAPGDLSTVLAQGISWGMDQLPQNAALVRWLREYNTDAPPSRKVNFYGFDVPGSPASSAARRGHDTGLVEVLSFLRKVDSLSSAAFGARLQPFMMRMQFTLARIDNAPGYEHMSQAERDAFTAAITDLVALLERKEAQYTARSSGADYKWAHRAAVGARQMDNWLRQIPLGWSPSSREAAAREAIALFYATATDVRDRAQADNVDWILREEGPSGKILIFAARYHLSATRLKVRFIPDSEECEQEVAGSYLKRLLGSKLVTFGNLIGQGKVACGAYEELLPRALPESMDGIAAEFGAPLFLLDLRGAPDRVAEWLNEERQLMAGGQVLTVPVGQAFDILFYVDTVTPACAGATRSAH